VGSSTNILLVSPKLGVNNVRELIEYAKKEPGRLTYATSGIGSVAHLTSEMFAMMAGAKLTHVPYKGRNCRSATSPRARSGFSSTT
jgi:tripartite-type tricarboxylate transporter receptor subunit TctC